MTGFRSGEAERKELLRLYEELGSVGAVAARTGRHRNTVRRLLQATAIVPPAHGTVSAQPNPAAKSPASDTAAGGRARDGLSGNDLRVLRAVARSAQVIICRDAACGQEFATFALETKAGKRLRTFCPACGRGAVMRIAGSAGDAGGSEDDGE